MQSSFCDRISVTESDPYSFHVHIILVNFFSLLSYVAISTLKIYKQSLATDSLYWFSYVQNYAESIISHNLYSFLKLPTRNSIH